MIPLFELSPSTVTVERKHTTEGSFVRTSDPYTSPPSSTQFRENSVTASTDHTRLLKSLRTDETGENRADTFTHKDDNRDVVFLTKDELKAAEALSAERFREEAWTIPEVVGDRPEVKTEADTDPGLRWLYESSVTFVDCSTLASNKVKFHLM